MIVHHLQPWKDLHNNALERWLTKELLSKQAKLVKHQLARPALSDKGSGSVSSK